MLMVVKVGTNSVIDNIHKIARDIRSAKEAGIKIVLVSSGAIGMGRSIYKNRLGNSAIEQQVLAGIGQVELIKSYREEFDKHDLYIGQILITKKDIESIHERSNIENMLRYMLDCHDIIPIVNENDSVAIHHSTFVDNDEIAGMLASILGADRLVILTNVDGLYDDFTSKNKKVLRRLYIDEIPLVTAEKSSMGRGGMKSKVNVAKKLSKLGISCTICSVLVDDVLARVSRGEEVGTTFLSRRDAKADKTHRHLAFEPGINLRGSVVVSRALDEKIDRDEDGIAILPVDVVKVVGIFAEGDLVSVGSEQGRLLAYGLAGYSSEVLLSHIGKDDMKPFMAPEHVYYF